MEYIYKISAIEIDELAISRTSLEEIHKQFLYNLKYGSVNYYTAQDVIKKKYLTYLNISWQNVAVFGKNSRCVGILHRDTESTLAFSWALNWVWGENCVMEYWADDQLSNIEFEPSDGYGGNRIVANSVNPPTKTYIMEPGVYLVNTSTFHRPSTSGSNMRYTLSLRAGFPKFKMWEDVVERFKNLIVK